MKAALLKNWEDMQMCDVDIPEISEGEALIKMNYAGVCGSDITVYSGKHPTATVPVVVGHEILGLETKNVGQAIIVQTVNLQIVVQITSSVTLAIAIANTYSSTFIGKTWEQVVGIFIVEIVTTAQEH